MEIALTMNLFTLKALISAIYSLFIFVLILCILTLCIFFDPHKNLPIVYLKTLTITLNLGSRFVRLVLVLAFRLSGFGFFCVNASTSFLASNQSGLYF